jgi:putative spermidine/putrescine transport system ATP-binding protein
LDAGAAVRLPAPQGIGAGALVVLSVRPEQLVLSPVATADSWPIEPGLSLPLGSQLVHEARTSDGAALKIVEPRRRSASDAQRRFCALAPDARPSLFQRSTHPATE